MAEAIVAAALVGVVEDLERFGRFFEAIDGFLVARVVVRVILDRQLAIRRRDLAVRGGSLDARIRSSHVAWPCRRGVTDDRDRNDERSAYAVDLAASSASPGLATLIFYANGPLARMTKWPACGCQPVTSHGPEIRRLLTGRCRRRLSCCRLLVEVRDQGLGREHQAGDAGRIAPGRLARPSSGR